MIDHVAAYEDISNLSNMCVAVIVARTTLRNVYLHIFMYIYIYILEVQDKSLRYSQVSIYPLGSQGIRL
jgi:hypothetical protein